MCLYNYPLDGIIREYCNKWFDVRNHRDTSTDMKQAKWMTFIFMGNQSFWLIETFK